MKEKGVLIETGTSRKLHDWRLHSLYRSENINRLIEWRPPPPKVSLLWRSGGACMAKWSWELTRR